MFHCLSSDATVDVNVKTCFECVVYEMLLRPLMKNSTYTSLQRSAYLCYWSAFFFSSSSFWLGWEKNMLAECSSVVNTFTLPWSIQSSSFKLCKMITHVDTFSPVHTSFNNHTRLPFWWDLKQWQTFGLLCVITCVHVLLPVAACELPSWFKKQKKRPSVKWLIFLENHVCWFVCCILQVVFHIVGLAYSYCVYSVKFCLIVCRLCFQSLLFKTWFYLKSEYPFLKCISKRFCLTLFNITHVGFHAWCIWGLWQWMK